MAATAIFRLGDSITATVEMISYTESRITSIVGSGPMYENASDFICVSVTGQPPYGDTVSWTDHIVYNLKGSVIIPDGITTIANDFVYTINNWWGVNEIYIGSSVETIGNRAFYNTFDSTLDTVVCASSKINYIGQYAFANLLEDEIDFHGANPYIDEYAFYRCRQLKYTHFGKDIEMIGEAAFLECTALIEFNDGNVINNIADWRTFGYCNNIDHFEFGENVEIREDPFPQTYYLTKGSGSKPNKDGYQITKIKTKNPNILAHDWIKYENRYPVFENGVPFIVLNHMGKTIVINGYDKETGHIPVKHGDVMLWLRVVPEGSSDASPLVIKTSKGNKFIGN